MIPQGVPALHANMGLQPLKHILLKDNVREMQDALETVNSNTLGVVAKAELEHCQLQFQELASEVQTLLI